MHRLSKSLHEKNLLSPCTPCPPMPQGSDAPNNAVLTCSRRTATRSATLPSAKPLIATLCPGTFGHMLSPSKYASTLSAKSAYLSPSQHSAHTPIRGYSMNKLHSRRVSGAVGILAIAPCRQRACLQAQLRLCATEAIGGVATFRSSTVDQLGTGSTSRNDSVRNICGLHSLCTWHVSSNVQDTLSTNSQIMTSTALKKATIYRLGLRKCCIAVAQIVIQ